MGDAVVSPAEPEAPAQSFPERLMGVFISPGETFEDVARKPGFWAPLITLVVAAVAVTETMLWKIGMERIIRMQIALSSRASSMSPEDIDKAVAMQAKVGGIIAHFIGLVAVPIVLLILAGLGILVVNVIFGARTNFKTVFSLVSYANLVSLIGSLMAIAVIFFGDPDQFNSQNFIPSNIGFFLRPNQVSKPLYALASSADFLSVWMVILLGVGLSKGTAGKVKPTSIILVFVGLWILWILAKIGLSMIGS
ncbi:MAG: YIP1 family protein [Terriglobia bacterium]|jgi:hypothetical protein